MFIWRFFKLIAGFFIIEYARNDHLISRIIIVNEGFLLAMALLAVMAGIAVMVARLL